MICLSGQNIYRKLLSETLLYLLGVARKMWKNLQRKIGIMTINLATTANNFPPYSLYSNKVNSVLMHIMYEIPILKNGYLPDKNIPKHTSNSKWK